MSRIDDIFNSNETGREDDYEVTQEIEETPREPLPDQTHRLLFSSRENINWKQLDYLLRNSPVIADYRLIGFKTGSYYVSMIYNPPIKFDDTVDFFIRAAQILTNGATENEIRQNHSSRRLQIIQHSANFTVLQGFELMKLANVNNRSYFDPSGVINLNETIRHLWNLFNENTKSEIDEDIKRIGFFLGWRDIRHKIMYEHGGYALEFKFYYEYDYPEGSVFRSKLAEIKHPIILRGKNLMELYSRYIIFLDILKMKHSPLLTERVRMTDVAGQSSLSLTGIMQEWCRIENPDFRPNDTHQIKASLNVLDNAKKQIQTLKPNDPMYYAVFEEALNRADVSYVMTDYLPDQIDIYMTPGAENSYLTADMGTTNKFIYYNRSYREDEPDRRHIQ